MSRAVEGRLHLATPSRAASALPRLLALLLLACSTPVFAEDPGAIDGTVVDAEGGAAVVGARLVAALDATRLETVTDARGRFGFATMAPGTWRVSILAAGFTPATVELAVESGEPTSVSIALSRAKAAPTGARTVADPTSIARITPRIATVSIGRGSPPPARGPGQGRPGGGPPGGRPPGAGPPAGGPPGGRPPGGGPPGGMPRGGPPAGARFGAPSTTTLSSGTDVTAAIDGSSGMVLRGVEPGASRIWLDGLEVPAVMHGGNLRPVMPVGLLGSASFYPGSFPAEYGRATAGLVALSTRDDVPNHLAGTIDLSTADVSASLRVPLGEHMALAVGGQQSVLDEVFRRVIPSTVDTTLSALPRYQDAHAQWTWQPSSTLDVQVLALASRDSTIDWFGNPADGEPAPGTYTKDTWFQRALARVRWAPRPDLELRLLAGGGQDHFSQTGFSITDQKLQARPQVTFRWTDTVELAGGLDYLLERPFGSLGPSVAPAGLPLAGDTRVGPRSNNAVGGHVRAKWRALPALELEPGLRVDDYAYLGDQLVADPRVVARWTVLGQPGLADALLLKGAVGLFHRPPSALQVDPTIGNPALQAESALQTMVGLEYRPVSRVRLDVSGFWASRSDVVVSSTARVTRNGAAVPEVWSNAGVGQTMGLEVLAQVDRWHDVEAWAAYTLSTSTVAASATAAASPSPYDQTHVLSAFAAWNLPGQVRLSGRVQYSTGNPTTAVTGSVFDSSTNQYLPITTATLAGRTPDFFQLDARVDKTWTLGDLRLTTYLDVRNLTNRANVVEPLTYAYDYVQQKGRTGLPLTPMLGVRGEF